MSLAMGSASLHFEPKNDLVTCQAHQMHLAITDYLKEFRAEVLTEEDVDLADLESDDVPAVAYGADQDRADRESSVPLVRKVSTCTQGLFC